MNKQQNDGKITALYERLSKDDEQTKNESVSIAHQKQILEDYARKNGFPNTRHFTEMIMLRLIQLQFGCIKVKPLKKPLFKAFSAVLLFYRLVF